MHILKMSQHFQNSDFKVLTEKIEGIIHLLPTIWDFLRKYACVAPKKGAL